MFKENFEGQTNFNPAEEMKQKIIKIIEDMPIKDTILESDYYDIGRKDAQQYLLSKITKL